MAAFQSIVHGSSLIADISNSVGDLQNSQPPWQSGPSFAKRLQEIEEDLVYLEGNLVDTKTRIEQLQLMVRALPTDRTAWLIGPSTLLLLIIQADSGLSQAKTRPSSLHSNIGGSIVYSLGFRFCMWKLPRWRRFFQLIFCRAFWEWISRILRPRTSLALMILQTPPSHFSRLQRPTKLRLY